MWAMTYAGISVFSQSCQEMFAEVFGLACADTIHRPQRLHRLRLETRHLAQRRVVKDDVGGHAAGPRDLHADGAELLEQLSVHTFPGLRLHPRLSLLPL